MSQASVGSSAPDQRHISLIKASSAADESLVRNLLDEGPAWYSQMDRDALRHSLQKVAARGNLSLVRFLLQKGAEIDVPPETDIEYSGKNPEVPAIYNAVSAGHEKVAKELLDAKANTEWQNWKNRNGQTAIFAAVMRGYLNVARLLLEYHANVNARDKDGRTPLIHAVAEKSAPSTLAVVRLLLERGADIEARDSTWRTPLIWAAATNKIDARIGMETKVHLAEYLLSGKSGRIANVAAENNRGRTALHMAAENGLEDMVRLLLRYDADPRTPSDGEWTPLHNAAERGRAEVASLLLEAGANANAELSNGMTPLHWAAYNGHEDVVDRILARPNINLAIKDSFDRTPLLCAAEKHYLEIVRKLSPSRAGHRLTPEAREACERFESTVVDFGAFQQGKRQLRFKYSVYELLYGLNDSEKPTVNTLVRNIKHQPSFRWIHLPANNIAWVEALLAKAFVEDGGREIDDFKALEKCFGQQHRGPTVHAHFMRPLSQRMAMSHRRRECPENQALQAQVSLDLMQDTQAGAQQLNGSVDGTPKKHSPLLDQKENTPKSESKKKSKADQFAEKHHKKSKSSEKTNKLNQVGEKAPTSKASKYPTTPYAPGSNGKLVLFMPFLHYESDEGRYKMSSAIKRKKKCLDMPEDACADDFLIEAYLDNTPPMHPARTLDQFFYHGIDTSERDRDQVVYRYCKRRKQEPRVFMVDQLWLWIISKELIITSFPERWQQPKTDPLNVLSGIIEDMNAKTRPPIQSVYDLAMLITTRCAGMFDRHRPDYETYQFLDMFESSIGHLTNQETKLFGRFNRASAAAATWLKKHRRGRHSAARNLPSHSPHRENHPQQGLESIDSDDDESDPIFVDTLLDIDVETSLLTEIKDIRDELNILSSVLTYQSAVLNEFADHIVDELRRETHEGVNRQSNEIYVSEIRKRSREQARILDTHRNDLYRLDKQALSSYDNLAHLLDLKQKHANAFEARFARDQAVTAAKQGQTVMVFTIVTILFLPMGFIAAFFAIQTQEWTERPLHVGHVSKYTFGIGLAISVFFIAMAFAVHDIRDMTRETIDMVNGWSRYIRRRRKTPKEQEGQEVTPLNIKEKLDTLTSAPRPSFDPPYSYDVGLSPVRASIGERSYEFPDVRLSPVSAVMPRQRLFASSKANAVTWARTSLDRDRGRKGKMSDDLERG